MIMMMNVLSLRKHPYMKYFCLEIPQATGISTTKTQNIENILLESATVSIKFIQNCTSCYRLVTNFLNQLCKNAVSQGISKLQTKPISVGNSVKMRYLKVSQTLLRNLHKQSKNAVSQGISHFLKMRYLKVSHKFSINRQ